MGKKFKEGQPALDWDWSKLQCWGMLWVKQTVILCLSSELMHAFRLKALDRNAPSKRQKQDRKYLDYCKISLISPVWKDFN